MGNLRKHPRLFEPAMCSACGSTTELQKHKYSDEIQCITCVNDELARIAAEEEHEREGYYTDYSYNQLCEERNK